MLYLLLFATCALCAITFITLTNVLFFPRLRAKSPIQHPFISVLIPARNEAAVIGQTVQTLLAQDYAPFEVILLDDHSTDGTSAIAFDSARGDARLRIVNGQELPHGWMGKSWACQQLGQLARGEVLIFTDADVQWGDGALSAVVTQLNRTHADLFTVWPTQQTFTPTERLIVPLMAFAILCYLPVIGTHFIPLALFAAANGQCMVWRRSAYQTIGGHQAVANNVLDDVSLARLVKGHRLKLRMADGAGLIQCRMYTGWRGVRDGFAKNILAGYGNSVPVLIVATLFHIAVFIAPFAGLLHADYALWALGVLSIGVLLRAVSAAFTQQRVRDALWMPFSVLLMTRIAIHAIYWHYTGGPRWKGRTISAQTNATTEEEGTWHNNPSSSSAQASGD